MQNQVHGNYIAAPMCVNTWLSDYLKDAIPSWVECKHTGEMWILENKDNGIGEEQVFISVGTSIGACVKHVLFTMSAQVVGFEPNPHYPFCLTSMQMELKPKYH